MKIITAPPTLADGLSVQLASATAQRLTLIDDFYKQLTYLWISITNFCNFCCNYCLPNGYTNNGGRRPNNELSLSEIQTLITGFARLSTTKVRLTGGEPSIRADLPQIIALAKQTQGVKTVALSSNGYRLAKQLTNWQTTVLDKLNISIDS